MAEDASGGLDTGTEWEGYSDYRTVSKSVAQSVDTAIDHFTWLDSIHQESSTPQSDQVAMVRSSVLAAALKLYVEMREEHEEGNNDYDEILARWGTGIDEFDDLDADGDEFGDLDDGFIKSFREAELKSHVPDWALQFLLDTRTAGFRLGYLQAGRRTTKDHDDPVEGDARSMLGQ